LQIRFDFRCNLLHLSRADRAFIAGFDDSREQFAFIEHFAGSILLDDDQGQTFHHLVGSKSFLTGQAFTSASDAAVAFRGTGVNDSALRISANRAFHGLYLQKMILCTFTHN
jgi:hypothetical protein